MHSKPEVQGRLLGWLYFRGHTWWDFLFCLLLSVLCGRTPVLLCNMKYKRIDKILHSKYLHVLDERTRNVLTINFLRTCFAVAEQNWMHFDKYSRFIFFSHLPFLKQVAYDVWTSFHFNTLSADPVTSSINDTGQVNRLFCKQGWLSLLWISVLRPIILLDWLFVS